MSTWSATCLSSGCEPRSYITQIRPSMCGEMTVTSAKGLSCASTGPPVKPVQREKETWSREKETANRSLVRAGPQKASTASCHDERASPHSRRWTSGGREQQECKLAEPSVVQLADVERAESVERRRDG